MRGLFAGEIYKQIKVNKNIFVVVGDVGYMVWDEVKRDFPHNFINAGASEQAMMDIGIGLALSGKIPIVYTITPFLLYRPFESIRTYINHEKIPVKMVGSGRDRDYEILGFSHWSEDDRDVMRLFPNIVSCWPTKSDEIPALVELILNDKRPYYINLKKNL